MKRSDARTGTGLTVATPVYRMGRRASRTELVLLHGFQVHGIENVPREGGAMIVANHTSFLDIPIVAASLMRRHVCFVARESLTASRFLAFLMRESGSILIRRDTADRQALEAMVDHLRRDDLVCVFPEGTRSRNGELGEFRPGALFAAKRARVPIVPAAIRGAIHALPSHAKFPRPCPIDIVYGPPIDGTRRDAMELAREAIVGLLEVPL